MVIHKTYAGLWKLRDTFAAEKLDMYKRGSNSGRSSGDSRGGKTPFKKTTGSGRPKTGERTSDRKPAGDRKPYGSRGGERDTERTPRKTGSYNRENSSDRKYSDRKSAGDRKPYGSRGGERDAERTPRKRSSYNREDSGDRKFSDRKPTGDRKPYGSRERDTERTPRKTGYNREGSADRKPAGDRKPYDSRARDTERTPRKTGYNREGAGDRKFSDKKPTGDRKPYGSGSREKDSPRTSAKTRSFREGSEERGFSDRKPASRVGREYAGKPAKEENVKSRSGRGPRKSDLIFDKKKAQKDDKPAIGNIRLNRYIANAGICSRREADDLITAGVVSVNGVAVTEMGYQVKPSDEVRYNGQLLSREKKVYLLLNKPKDSITTFDDPAGRRTVMELFGNELGERIYPVGRLDRNTTGVLLFTNDGDMAQRLMHPKYEMTKVYRATLNKNFKGEDLWQLQNGVELEDGFIKPDAVAIPDPKNKNEIGIEIHSGKNHIIHRMFEHLGYKVDKLDRALYAGLTKGKLKRGEWRHLTEKEVNALKRVVKL